MTEEEIRRIVREEVRKALSPPGIIAAPALPNYPIQPLPMPRYEYQSPEWTPPSSTRSGFAS